MDQRAVIIVLKGFQAFQPRIQIKTSENLKTLIEQALTNDPKMVYYLKSLKYHTLGSERRIDVEYENRETDRKDIYIISSSSECESLLNYYVGNYKKKLILVSKTKLNIDKELDSFRERSSFYANYMGASRTNCSWLGLNFIEITFQYRIGRVKLEQMEIEVDNEVERISKMIFRKEFPTEVKIYLAHNYLASTVEYVKDRKNNLRTSYTQSAYGAFIQKQCVCQGYAEAFKRLMDSAGIECDVVCGQIIKTSGYHAWNIISLGKGSSYYHVDVTWDTDMAINGKNIEYEHFCKNDAFFKGKRTWNGEYNHKCNGSYPVLAVARKYVMQNKEKMLAYGIDRKILDC